MSKQVFVKARGADLTVGDIFYHGEADEPNPFILQVTTTPTFEDTEHGQRMDFGCVTLNDDFVDPENGFTSAFGTDDLGCYGADSTVHILVEVDPASFTAKQLRILECAKRDYSGYGLIKYHGTDRNRRVMPDLAGSWLDDDDNAHNFATMAPLLEYIEVSHRNKDWTAYTVNYAGEVLIDRYTHQKATRARIAALETELEQLRAQL